MDYTNYLRDQIKLQNYLNTSGGLRNKMTNLKHTPKPISTIGGWIDGELSEQLICQMEALPLTLTGFIKSIMVILIIGNKIELDWVIRRDKW